MYILYRDKVCTILSLLCYTYTIEVCMLIKSTAVRSDVPFKPNNTVNFTRKQVEYLNKLFPERVLDAKTTTECEVWLYFGTRRVIKEIELRIQD